MCMYILTKIAQGIDWKGDLKIRLTTLDIAYGFYAIISLIKLNKVYWCFEKTFNLWHKLRAIICWVGASLDDSIFMDVLVCRY